MKLFLISQNQRNEYDTYDSAVVAAPDKETAKQMDPRDGMPMDWDSSYSWCTGPEYVTVEYLGEAFEKVQGIICASFNAG